MRRASWPRSPVDVHDPLRLRHCVEYWVQDVSTHDGMFYERQLLLGISMATFPPTLVCSHTIEMDMEPPVSCYANFIPSWPLKQARRGQVVGLEHPKRSRRHSPRRLSQCHAT